LRKTGEKGTPEERVEGRAVFNPKRETPSFRSRSGSSPGRQTVVGVSSDLSDFGYTQDFQFPSWVSEAHGHFGIGF
jgi:hypothetical protein